RAAIYASTAATLWVLAAVVLVAAVISGFPPAALGLRAIAPGPLVLWTVGVTGAGLLLLGLTRALRVRESPMLIHLLPRNRAERGGAAGIRRSGGHGGRDGGAALPRLPALGAGGGDGLGLVRGGGCLRTVRVPAQLPEPGRCAARRAPGLRPRPAGDGVRKPA